MSTSTAPKTILVTGGSAGIGLAIAERLGRDGNRVVLAARNEERLAAAQALLRAQNIDVGIIGLDVRDNAAVSEAIDNLDTIDGVVNNAAGNFACPAEEMSLNGFRAVVEISLYGTFNASTALARRLIRESKSGAICNIITTYAWTGGPGVAHSAAAKAAMLAFGKSVAGEWGAHGIRVNSVAPGFVETENATDNILSAPGAAAAMLTKIPLGRFAQADEVAGSVSYLMGDEASYVTGAVLTIDGGRSLGQAMHAAQPRQSPVSR
ncbi:SDR family oxidoreductase [Nocardia sp. NPDC024068]|uniref:SDR family oxidoreductase n=1 Tax=Nocardia sp. NPDC024068 TaxID=3157197 RepID=UPI0034033109